MRLIGHGRHISKALNVAAIVLANQHVHSCRAAEVESGLGRSQDLIEVRGHPPPLSVALEEAKRECRPAKDIGVEPIRS
jgi:hypothetical protein